MKLWEWIKWGWDKFLTGLDWYVNLHQDFPIGAAIVWPVVVFISLKWF